MAHKIRFLSISLVIAVGIASFNIMITAFIHLDNTYQTAFRNHDMASFTVQTANPGGSGSDAWIDYDNLTTYLNDFQNQDQFKDNIESFELRIVFDSKFVIRGVKQNGRIVAYNTTDSEKNFRNQPTVNGYKLLEGTNFSITSQYRNVCLVEGHLAEYWKLEPNEFISAGDQSVPFQIFGVIASPEYLMNMGSYADLLPSPRRFGVIFMPLRTAQRLLDVPGKVNEISVKLKAGLTPMQRESIADDLKDYLEGTHDLKFGDPVDILEQVSYYLLRLDIEEAKEMGILLPIIILGMAMGGLYVLLGRMVVAERKDIGVAQALGYSRNTIIAQYLGMAIIVSVIGSLIGTVLGVIAAGFFSPVYVDVITLQFPAIVTFEWPLALVGVILGLITGLIGGYLPVKGSIQPLPAESLRFDPSLHITSGKIPLAERLLNRINIHFRVTGLRLPIRNFFRSKRRTFSSIFAVIISVSLISMAFGMIESMDKALENQYTVVEDWDLRIDYGEIPTNSSDIVNAINSIEDVNSSTYQLLSGASITSTKSTTSKTVQLIGMKEIDGYLGHKFPFEKGSFTPEGVVLSVPVSEKLHVSVNDDVSLELPRLTKIVDTVPLRAHFEMVNITFRVSGIIDEFNGLVAYVGLDHLKDVSNFPGTPANTILIKVNNPTPTNLDRIKNEIESNYSYNIRNIYTRAEQTTDLLVLLDALYWVMYVVAVFAVLLAVAMVYNTVYINLQEQQREIATLLTIGTERRKLIRNVTFENFLISLIGTVLGLIFGWILLWFFMSVVLDMEFFRIKLFISNTTILIGFVYTFIGILFAQFFPLRKTLNLNLAEATKERVV
jgi:putative ABC transport system permease protein